MGYLVNNPAGFLLSAQTNSGTGLIADTRAAANYAFLQYASEAPSAVVKLQASVDTLGWLDIGTYTASPTTATAQLSGYYPYVRAVVNSAFGGAGSTGSASLYYAPGLK